MTCAPLACAWVNAGGEGDAGCRRPGAPAECARVSGAATVIVPPGPGVEATTAVSESAPLSMVMVWPSLKPATLATGIYGRAHGGGGAHRGGACRANRRNDGGLEVRARIDPDGLAGGEACHAGDLDVGRAGGRSDRQGCGGLRQEIGAVAAGVSAVREAARAGDWLRRRAKQTAEAAGRAGRRREAAALLSDPEAAW